MIAQSVSSCCRVARNLGGSKCPVCYRPVPGEVCVLVVESDGSIRRFVDGTEIKGFTSWRECVADLNTHPQIVRVLQGMF